MILRCISLQFKRFLSAVLSRPVWALLVVPAACCLAFSRPQTVHGASAAPPELTSQPLSMQKAVDYALEHNRIVLSAKQDVQAVGQQVKQAQSDFFPKVDAYYTFTHLADQPFASFTTGGSTAGPTSFPTSHRTLNHWEVDMNQPLFTGFGLTANLERAKLGYRISEYNLDETRLDVIRGVQRTFLQVLLAQKLLEVARDNVESLQMQKRNAEASYGQGLTAQNDVLKADVALAQARERERQAAKDLSIIRARLNQLLDIDLDTQLELSEEEIHLNPPPPIEELFARAERRRPEYLSLGTSIEQIEQSIRAAKSRYYPQVSAFAQYYREGEDFLAETNDYTNNHNAAVGVRVDWNWFEGGRTNATANELKYRRNSLEERRRNLLQEIRIQVEDAYEQLKVARANVETAQTAVKQAEENQRMTTLQYKEQLAIFLDVLTSQVSLAQARTNYYHALYGYQLAWADLERAIGGAIKQ